MNKIKLLSTISCLSIISIAYAEKKAPNVLFICIDDLRSEVGCYGTQAISPNIDALASQGSLFTNQYVQVPTSGASRASMLTGLIPREKIDLKNGACDFHFASEVESETPETMFHLLRRNGYYTAGMGKLTHSATGRTHYKNAKGKNVYGKMLKFSLDTLKINCGSWGDLAVLAYADGKTREDKNKEVKPYECADVPDTGYPDGLVAQTAVETLEELSKGDKPFCLAVGFVKPHLPFNAPKKYWDLYNRDEIKLSDYKDIPKGGVPSGNSGEFNQYKLGDEKASSKKNISDDYARKLRHGYLACISYVDAQVGKVLTKLNELGLDDNTIVIVWGDHGWNLGDMRVWGKHTIYEPSLRSTFIIKSPGGKKGVVNNRIIAATDIYPTLMELCGVKFTNKVDGDSFAKLLKNPNDKNWRDNALSFWGSRITLRTPEYRLMGYNGNESKASYQLYKLDGFVYERENIASSNPEIVNKLAPVLNKLSQGTATELKSAISE